MPYEKALEKAKWYCSFQERCIQDLEKRFYAWRVKKEEWDLLLDVLMEQDFLNEDRYIEEYIRGKFSVKKWGKIKIKAALMNKRITGKKVDEELNNIDDGLYLKTLTYLAEKKKEQLANEEDKIKRKDKLYRYLLSKGYESEFILKMLRMG